MLTATVDRDRIGVNDVIEFTVTATGEPGEPIRIDLPPFTGFAFSSARNAPTCCRVLRSTVLTLRLRATRAGQLRLRPDPRGAGHSSRPASTAPTWRCTENAAAGMVALNPRVRDLVARAPPPRQAGSGAACR